MIAFTCAFCRKKFSAKEELAGKKVRCPHCAKVTRVPNQPVVALVASEGPQAFPSVAFNPDQRALPPMLPPVPEHSTAPPPSLSDVAKAPSPGEADQRSGKATGTNNKLE